MPHPLVLFHHLVPGDMPIPADIQPTVNSINLDIATSKSARSFGFFQHDPLALENVSCAPT
jgi:hypothetical protein